MTEFTIDPLILSVRIRVSPSNTEYRAVTGVRGGVRISRLEARRSSRGVGFFIVTLREMISERDMLYDLTHVLNNQILPFDDSLKAMRPISIGMFILKAILSFVGLFTAHKILSDVTAANTTVTSLCTSFQVAPGTGCDWMCNYCALHVGSSYYFTDGVCSYKSGGCVGSPQVNKTYTCCSTQRDL